MYAKPDRAVCGAGVHRHPAPADLTELCEKRGLTLRADALRSDPARPLRPGAAERLCAQFTDPADPAALPRYDLVFITNPTSLHADALRRLRGRAGAFFIEKPIFSAEQTGTDLSALLPAGQKAYVAAPMRWCGTMLALKQALKTLRPYCARVLCSSYLPDWRPGWTTARCTAPGGRWAAG